MTITTFLLVLGSTARIVRFIADDKLAEPVRDRLLNRVGYDSMRGYLLTCFYCLSIWVAAGAVAAAWWFGQTPWFQIPALMLSVSMLASWALVWLERD